MKKETSKLWGVDGRGRLKFRRVEGPGLGVLKKAVEKPGSDPEMTEFFSRVGLSRCVRDNWFLKGDKWWNEKIRESRRTHR